MKYYEMHEKVYQNLNKQGYISWDKEKELEGVLNHEINASLLETLSSYFPKTKDVMALDIGTGSGTVALKLSDLGMKVTGFDVSSTAIKMAKRNAKSLGSDIKFDVCDIVTDEINEKFDLVIDSSFLHCIVDNSDRKTVLNKIKNSFNKDGVFFVHTMVQTEDKNEMAFGEHFILEDDILWSKGPTDWNINRTVINGEEYFPHRRISSKESLIREIETAGFNLESRSIKSFPGNPDVFVGWFRFLS